MDSGNSESFQSSSGGDEEYDSRPESISALLNINNNPQTHIASMSNQQPLPPNHHLQSSSPTFDSLPNFFDPLSSSRSLLNFDMVWPKTVRSEPNCNYLGGLVLPSSSSTQNQNQNQIQRQLFVSNNQLGQTTNRAGSTTFPGIQIPQENANATQRGNSNSSVSNDQNTPINNSSNITNVVVRNNPKKRSRASRRAPTTVLTTDTTNFRAMVQEFTGIPAPPFTSSSSFPRTRFDLFGSSSSVSLSQSPYNNLLRPFTQKVVSNSATNNVVSNISTTSVNYHQLSSSSSSSSSDQLANFLKPPLPHHHSHQQQFNINMQNPILNFQSLLQTQQKYPPSASVVEDQFGLSHGQVNHWGSHGVGSNDNTNGRNDNVDQVLVMRSINEGNYSTHSERQVVSEDNKRPEINVTPRSEGIVESWICSSD